MTSTIHAKKHQLRVKSKSRCYHELGVIGWKWGFTRWILILVAIMFPRRLRSYHKRLHPCKGFLLLLANSQYYGDFRQNHVWLYEISLKKWRKLPDQKGFCQEENFNEHKRCELRIFIRGVSSGNKPSEAADKLYVHAPMVMHIYGHTCMCHAPWCIRASSWHILPSAHIPPYSGMQSHMHLNLGSHPVSPHVVLELLYWSLFLLFPFVRFTGCNRGIPWQLQAQLYFPMKKPGESMTTIATISGLVI